MIAYIQPVSSGITDDTNEDTNDCALRAYCNVTGVSFKDAQIRFAKQGRKYRRGAQIKAVHNVYTNAGMKCVVMGSTVLSKYVSSMFNMKSISNARTLKSLLNDAKYNKGKHVFISTKHAMSMIDGKMVDTFASKESTRIYLVYSMPDAISY